MQTIVNIVWALGSEGYHVEQMLRKYPEPEVLAAVAEQLLAMKLALTYTDAMRRSVEIVEYHRFVGHGATPGKSAHKELQRTHAGPRGSFA